jgi:hypothetical protein
MVEVTIARHLSIHTSDYECAFIVSVANFGFNIVQKHARSIGTLTVVSPGKLPGRTSNSLGRLRKALAFQNYSNFSRP